PQQVARCRSSAPACIPGLSPSRTTPARSTAAATEDTSSAKSRQTISYSTGQTSAPHNATRKKYGSSHRKIRAATPLAEADRARPPPSTGSPIEVWGGARHLQGTSNSRQLLHRFSFAAGWIPQENRMVFWHVARNQRKLVMP